MLNRDHPDALLIGLDQVVRLQAPGMGAALATTLLRDGEPSLVRAARAATMDVTRFFSHLDRRGIPAIRLSASANTTDLDTLEQWLLSSSSMPAP